MYCNLSTKYNKIERTKFIQSGNRKKKEFIKNKKTKQTPPRQKKKTEN